MRFEDLEQGDQFVIRLAGAIASGRARTERWHQTLVDGRDELVIGHGRAERLARGHVEIEIRASAYDALPPSGADALVALSRMLLPHQGTIPKEREGGATFLLWLAEQVIAGRAALRELSDGVPYIKSTTIGRKETKTKSTLAGFTMQFSSDEKETLAALEDTGRDLESARATGAGLRYAYAERQAIKWGEAYAELHHHMTTSGSTASRAPEILDAQRTKVRQLAHDLMFVPPPKGRGNDRAAIDARLIKARQLAADVLKLLGEVTETTPLVVTDEDVFDGDS